MDNIDQPADFADQPTEPYGKAAPGTGLPASPVPAEAQQRLAPRRRHGRAARWAAAGLLTASLLAGCLIAAADLAGSSAATAGRAGSAGQAGVLNSVLSSAASPAAGLTTPGHPSPAGQRANARLAARCPRLVARLRQDGHPRAAVVVRRFCLHRLARLRLLGALHGQLTFRTAKGPRTLAFERGVIQSVSGTSVVVRASDGTTWSWDLVSRTIVRKARHRASRQSLAAGERVFVAGPVTGAAKDARLIVIGPLR